MKKGRELGHLPDEKPPDINPPSDPKNLTWTIKLPEPSTRPLRLRVRIRHSRTGKPVQVGPFGVFNAYRQQGTIAVSAPADVRLSYQLQGDINRGEVPEDRSQDSKVVASFN